MNAKSIDQSREYQREIARNAEDHRRAAENQPAAHRIITAMKRMMGSKSAAPAPQRPRRAEERA